MRKTATIYSALVLALIFVSSVVASEGAGYDPKRDPAADLAVAMEEASSSDRRILLEVGGEWCHWCHILEKFFKNNAELQALLNDNYIVVKVNYSPENENEAFMAKYPAFKGYPHIIVLDSDGTHLHSQDTGSLEKGEDYDPDAMKAFLIKWAD